MFEDEVDDGGQKWNGLMTIQRSHFSARQFSGDISTQDKSAYTTFQRVHLRVRQVSAS